MLYNLFYVFVFSKRGEELATVCLEDLHMSDKPTTQLQSKYPTETSVSCEELCEEALKYLQSVQSSYLVAFSHMQEEVMASRLVVSLSLIRIYMMSVYVGIKGNIKKLIKGCLLKYLSFNSCDNNDFTRSKFKVFLQ